MKKINIILFTLIFSITSLFALSVDESEIKKFADSKTIEFTSYTGPHKYIDSAESIRNIGSNLGNYTKKDVNSKGTFGNLNKYYVIHAVNSDETEKLDADILILGDNAAVDHIKNLRRIIGSYLESSYGYAREDADALAVFITVYNAVYRGKLTELKDIYKKVVIENLTEDACGLSSNYINWPGKTQIIIPLYDVNNGGLSTVDTSVISDSKVVESMKDDDDKNVDSRKQMVDIKERESDDASEKAKESQKTAAEEQKKLDEQKKETEKVKKDAEVAQKKVDDKKKIADDKKQDADKKKEEAEQKKVIAEQNPDDKVAQEEAVEAEKEAEKAEEEVQQAEEEVQQAEEEVEQAEKEVEEQQAKQEEQTVKTEEAKEEAKKQQEFADKKQAEAQQERKEIASDQQEIKKQEIADAKLNTEYGLVITDENNMLSRLVKFDTATGKVVKNSPVTVIRNRVIYRVDDKYIAIAGEDIGNGAIKLVLIDDETMEIVSESSNAIAADSVLIQDGSDYYCVISENGNNYVAKFGEDLSLKLKSDVDVLSCTPITFTNSGLVVTDSHGTMKILSKSDLSEIKTEKTEVDMSIYEK